MTTTAPRFDSDDQFLAYLIAVNPRHQERPPDFDFTIATQESKALFQRLRTELGSDVQFDGDGAVQDASYHSGISIPPRGEVRLSNFDHLATITWEECVPPETLSRVVQILGEFGYTYVPFRLFGEPFGTRERINGDLFNQLFDYL